MGSLGACLVLVRDEEVKGSLEQGGGDDDIRQGH